MTRIDVEKFIKNLPESDFDRDFGGFTFKVNLVLVAIVAGIVVILRILWGLW